MGQGDLRYLLGGGAGGRRSSRRWVRRFLFLLILCGLLGCAKREAEGEDSDNYQPLELADWNVSTPEAQGLDPGRVLTAYRNASSLTNIYSLLIVKNGFLVAEKYFHGQAHNIANATASVTKSIVSCLTGIALRENILTSLDQTITEFFPEVDWVTIDSRKSQITIRQILQMRSGFPCEEFTGHLDQLLSRANGIPLIEEFPLMSDPGTEFGYSSLTAHFMAIIPSIMPGVTAASSSSQSTT